MTHNCPVTGSSSASAKSSSSVLKFCAVEVDARKEAKKKSDFQADIFALSLLWLISAEWRACNAVDRQLDGRTDGLTRHQTRLAHHTSLDRPPRCRYREPRPLARLLPSPRPSSLSCSSLRHFDRDRRRRRRHVAAHPTTEWPPSHGLRWLRDVPRRHSETHRGGTNLRRPPCSRPRPARQRGCDMVRLLFRREPRLRQRPAEPPGFGRITEFSILDQ